MSAIEQLPVEPTRYERTSAFQSFASATMALDQLGHLKSFTTNDYRALEAAKRSLSDATEIFEASDNPVNALRARTSLAFADLTARRNELISRRNEWRLPEGFHELFMKRAFINAGQVAIDGLDLYERERLNPERRRHIAGFLHELTTLLVTLRDDPLRFGVPASIYDDQFSDGFHFDIMLYDLTKPHDMRRAVDVKAFQRRGEAPKPNSRFARVLYASDTLRNNKHTTFWKTSEPAANRPHFPTLRALVGEPMIESPIEVREKLSAIQQDLFEQAFSEKW